MQTDSSAISSWSNNTTQPIIPNVPIFRQNSTSRNQRDCQRSGVFNSVGVQSNSSRNTNSFPVFQNMPSRSQSENVDSMGLDAFENEEDDFEQGLDYTVLDEIEKETLNKSKASLVLC